MKHIYPVPEYYHYQLVPRGMSHQQTIFLTVQDSWNLLLLEKSFTEETYPEAVTDNDNKHLRYCPIQWKKLPLSLRSLHSIKIQVETLKKDLKTHLLNKQKYFKSEK